MNALRLLVEDVERAVEVVDEEPPAARLVAQEVDPGELSARVLAVELAGDRHLHVVLELERQPASVARPGSARLQGRGQRSELPASLGPFSVLRIGNPDF